MRQSFKRRFTLFVSLGVTAMIVLIALVFAKMNIDTALTIFKENGVPIVKTAQGIVDGDRFESLAKSLNHDDPYYEQLRLELLDLRQTTNCRFLYTMTQKSGKDFYYVVDGSCDPSDKDNFSPMGTVEDITSYGEAPFDAMDKRIITVSDIEKQEDWGWTISVYAPITNSAGKVAGFVGCDFDVRPVITEIQKGFAKAVVVSIIAIALVIGSIVAYMAGFFRKMNAVITAMQSISQGEGDLTMQLDASVDDEMGLLSRSCNALNDRLRAIVNSIKDSVRELSANGEALNQQTLETISAAEGASSNMDKINEQAKDESRTMETVHTSVKAVENELLSLDKKIGEQSSQILSSSEAIKTMAKGTKEMSGQVMAVSNQQNCLVSLTKEGQDAQDEVGRKMQMIVEETKSLTSANAAIENIAEETNLLAMNAAIEAAHAGAAGQGFAVVAGEIRALAETSAKQSAAIERLVEKINESVEEVVLAAKKSASSFNEIGGQVSRVDVLLQSMRKSMDTQHKAAEDVFLIIQGLDTVTQGITSGNDKMKGESAALFDAIDEMRKQVSYILNTASQASSSLVRIQETAAACGEAAASNLAVTEEVHSLVSKFKT